MTEVVKRDGKIEEFSPEKVKRSIKMAAIDADIPEDRINEITDEVLGYIAVELENKKDVSTGFLRDTILYKLDMIEESVSEAWRYFDKYRKATHRAKVYTGQLSV